ncbi:MAG: DUF1772 domain-containing protein [Reyranella sp.]|jgi:uncharacterized membrane protein|uniref:anthrone oxygenase family protein n=1 Tax=Reyranella sp. TaxID=1929291 RepID=UPI0009656267|nr:anthrone oxygenase family protein [Reyranella sp.]MBN9539978.1 DUF1772 domain-containing protein [Alphaproteobacteria bacterium]MBR2814130.1 DUF1772 domain-containing protein [Reyranella sp.]OJU32521.1 MAG: hypothetical protein BGN99_21215 [Alphaproteobacteria bacterium 65-37]
MRHLFFVLALLCTGLSAGIFFTFSILVMPGLDLGGALSAIHAMQGINTVVRNALFAVVFFGALVLPLLAAFGARSAGHRGAARLAFLAALLQAVAVIGVTLQVNVPLNETLATVAASEATASGTWREFSGPWSSWNHVRTAGAILAFLGLLAAWAMDLTSTGSRRHGGLR